MQRVSSSPRPDPHVDTRRAAEREVRARLAESERTAFLATASMSPIVGGLSNYSWHARAGERECFVRLAHPGGAALGADHANECAVLQLTARARIAPPVVHCDPDGGVLVTQWITTCDGLNPDAACTLGDHERRGNGPALETVAQTLARLHALPVPGSLRRVDFAVQAKSLEASLDAGDVNRDAVQFRETASALFSQYTIADHALALCHHDLNPLNLLQDLTRQLWIVDWEYAGLGDPALDLASFACQHGLRPGQCRRLARAYREAGGAVDDDRLGIACWLFDYVQWLWYRAALVVDAAPAAVSLAEARARRLARSLRGRATRLLRCNNEVFSSQE